MPRTIVEGENVGLKGVAARLIQFAGGEMRKRFQASGFLRGASALFAGTVLAQATSLAIWPVLTRLYQPDQLGVLGTYIGVLTVLGAMALLRYENAIPIARHDSQANDLLALSGFALIGTSVIVAVAAYAIPDDALARAGMLDLAPYRFFIPFGFAWTGVYSALLSFATREAAFIAIARTRVSQALAGPASQVGMALAGFGTPGLLVGVIFSQCAGIIPLSKLALAKFKSTAHTVTISGMASVAREFRSFPLISSWGALVDAVGGAVALYLLIGMFYPATVTGYLFLTERAVGRPLRMVTSSLTPVAFAEAGRLVHTDPRLLRERFLQVTRRYAMFAAAWIIVVNVLATWLFPIAFGPGWSDAVPYVRAVSLWYFFGTVARAAGPLLLVLDRQFLNAFTQIAGPAAGIATFLYCGYHDADAVVSVWAYSMCQAVVSATIIPATLMAIRRLHAAAAGVE